jgi:tRNA-2-methylthio-N6-dimethylallyladenosine synthase
VGIHGLRKKEGARFVLGVIGCMAEREGPKMIRKFPQIDLMCGPGELDKLPMLIDNALKTEAIELADRPCWAKRSTTTSTRTARR